MLKKYNSIVRCRLRKGEEDYDDQYLLTSSEGNDFAVDLTGDLLFNEFDVTEISSFHVSSLLGVYAFCKNNSIHIPEECRAAKWLIVGGSRDFLINNELEGNWIPDEVDNSNVQKMEGNMDFKAYVEIECERQWNENQKEDFGEWALQSDDAKAEYYNDMYSCLINRKEEIELRR